jgi:hypothetical protein
MFFNPRRPAQGAIEWSASSTLVWHHRGAKHRAYGVSNSRATVPLLSPPTHLDLVHQFGQVVSRSQFIAPCPRRRGSGCFCFYGIHAAQAGSNS